MNLLRRVSTTPRGAVVAVALALVVGVALAGCARRGNSGDVAEHHHDHAEGDHGEEEGPVTAADIDMPRDYRAAVERLRQYRQQVLAAIDSKQLHDAHRPLDEMDLVINKLMVLARDSGVPRRDWEEVNLARREWRAQFDLAHAAIDKDESPDRAKLDQTTAVAWQRLEAIARQLADLETTSTGPTESARASEPQP